MSNDARLKTLTAKMDIIDLTHTIARAVDRCDVDLFCDCFTHGALFSSRVVTGPMPEAGHALFTVLRNAMRRTQHLVSNHIITIDGDRAKAEASVVATMFHDADGVEQELVFGGRYLDEYVCENGTWKVSARRIVVDYTRQQKSTHKYEGAYEGTSFKGTNNQQDPSCKYVFSPPCGPTSGADTTLTKREWLLVKRPVGEPRPTDYEFRQDPGHARFSWPVPRSPGRA